MGISDEKIQRINELARRSKAEGLTEEEKKGVPAGFETVPAKGLGKDAPAYSFRMQVSPYDCLGCGCSDHDQL